MAVEGMTCGACEHTVKAALEHLAPPSAQPISVVQVSNVSHTAESATVVVRTSDVIDATTKRASSDTKSTTVLRGSERLIAALDAVGFDAHVLSYKQIISADSQSSSTDIAAGTDNIW